MKHILSSAVRKCFPDIWYFIIYLRGARKIGDKSQEMSRHFKKLIAESKGKNCLQFGVRKEKYAPNWISVDLYDHSEHIDHHYDIQNLQFEKETFDVVVCNAILEHVENPVQAVHEMHRVLKNGGLIWVEVPFNQPYHPSPDDYWRVTVPGIRIWMKDFNEISTGFFKINRSIIYNGIYFYGQNRQ